MFQSGVTDHYSIKDLVGNLISAAALLVSLSTAYLTLLRGPKLRGDLGEVLLLRYLPDGRVDILPEVAFFNEGGRVATILRLAGRLRSLDVDRETKVTWNSNVATVYVGEGKIRTHTRFESFPTIMYVDRSEPVIKRIAMATQHSFELTQGDYEISIEVLAHSKMGTSDLTRKIKIRLPDTVFLLANKPRGDEMARNLRFDFDHNLGFYVSPLPHNWKPPLDDSTASAIEEKS